MMTNLTFIPWMCVDVLIVEVEKWDSKMSRLPGQNRSDWVDRLMILVHSNFIHD